MTSFLNEKKKENTHTYTQQGMLTYRLKEKWKRKAFWVIPVKDSVWTLFGFEQTAKNIYETPGIM